MEHFSNYHEDRLNQHKNSYKLYNENYNGVHQVYQFHQVCQSLSWTLKSPEINTLADGLIERTSSTLDETESKTMHKDE